MKKYKTIYWISTGLLGLLMSFSAYAYFTDPDAVENFRHLGFPNYFRVELVLAKIMGVVVLLIPQFPIRMKEWAYACFGLVFISAIVAHYSIGDEMSKVITPAIFLVVLIVSNIYYHKMLQSKGVVA